VLPSHLANSNRGDTEYLDRLKDYLLSQTDTIYRASGIEFPEDGPLEPNDRVQWEVSLVGGGDSRLDAKYTAAIWLAEEKEELSFDPVTITAIVP
jgi:hypothetical protein